MLKYSKRTFFPVILFATAAAVSLSAPSGLLPGRDGPALEAKEGIKIPLPKSDIAESGDRTVALFAGGCFWGVEAVFEHVRGVKSVQSGYAGGPKARADYNEVSGGDTGHAEAVRIVYDPSEVSYDQLMRVFFSIAHDPTQKNRQGPDTGSQYRSAIFPQNGAQKKAAESYIAQLDDGDIYAKPIATNIESGTFYPAETYHQNFMKKNPSHGYIVRWDKPKLENLKKIYPGYWKSSPAS